MSIEQQDVDRAFANGDFHPYFQPLVDLRTGGLQGFELLARWKHPDRGWIPPMEFIPSAEKDGWIDRLTRDLFETAFSTMRDLPSHIALSVNVSPVQLRGSGLPANIQRIAAETGFSTNRLIIEITESALTDDLDHARTISTRLKSMGCKLGLDDFGTGYSSLTHLQTIPFDEIKVDRSFVGSMAERRDSRKIVAAVVGLGQSLGLTTVAEGVETLEQVQMLQWLGCESAQGWFYGKALPAEALPDAVARLRQTDTPVASIDAVGRVSRGSFDVLPSVRLAQLQAVYDGAPVGLAFLDRDLRYRMLNRKLAQMNGRPMEDHVGKTVAQMIPELFPVVEPYIRRALDGEPIPGVEVKKPASETRDSQTILLSYEPARDEAGEVVGVSVAIMDLSPIKRAEEAQREAQEHFRHMIELLPQIPWIIDPEGRALDVSQRWLEVAGMKGDQWRGFGWLDALHPDDLQPTWDAMNRSFESGNPIDLVYRVRRSAANAWRRLRSRGAARLGADGDIICWYGCLEDLG
ncbi:EAL domain-containing protein [Sphingomonas sp. MMS24-J13]|uniref:sensor domain-containing phosphodiesterase n=1 Tax=Sphingomonas sp. MMS24-J13 TaxID=3238686 RepID=UPI00384CAB77